MAAFLGAGYRVPLAAVVFVAEFTGRPGFVIPGLVAAVVAQLCIGRRSISPYQAVAREGDVMPQKSTYFYPKALTGLVINPHEW